MRGVVHGGQRTARAAVFPAARAGLTRLVALEALSAIAVLVVLARPQTLVLAVDEEQRGRAGETVGGVGPAAGLAARLAGQTLLVLLEQVVAEPARDPAERERGGEDLAGGAGLALVGAGARAGGARGIARVARGGQLVVASGAVVHAGERVAHQEEADVARETVGGRPARTGAAAVRALLALPAVLEEAIGAERNALLRALLQQEGRHARRTGVEGGAGGARGPTALTIGARLEIAIGAVEHAAALVFDEEQVGGAAGAIVVTDFVARETPLVALEALARLRHVAVAARRYALASGGHEQVRRVAAETVVDAGAVAALAVGVAGQTQSRRDEVAFGTLPGHAGALVLHVVVSALAGETVAGSGLVAGLARLVAHPAVLVVRVEAVVALGDALGDGASLDRHLEEEVGSARLAFVVRAARAGGAHSVAVETLVARLVEAGRALVHARAERDHLQLLLRTRQTRIRGLRVARLAGFIAFVAEATRREVEAVLACAHALPAGGREVEVLHAAQTVVEVGPPAPAAPLVARDARVAQHVLLRIACVLARLCLWVVEAPHCTVLAVDITVLLQLSRRRQRSTEPPL